jgi:phosphoglucosamine mutase
MKKTKNIFINSGFRDKTTADFLQSKNIETLGSAIGYLLAEEFEYSCPILIATDTRPSGNKIKEALIKGLLNFGHDVFDAGICPTPFVAKALKDYLDSDLQDEMTQTEDEEDGDEPFFTLGIVITASHNPAEYNGIKILTPYGYLDIETEEEISDIFHHFLQSPQLMQEDLPDEPGSIIDFDLSSWYQSEILDEIEKLPTKISIILDCANGATAQIAPKIFTACGYNVIALHNSLDGNKINQNSEFNNQTELIETVKKNNAAWGCSFDGDGDRVIIVDKHGTIFDGDDIMCVLSNNAKYKNNKIIVGTIMTNTAIEHYLNLQNKKLIRTPVGERNLIEALIKHQDFLGAETCGHIIMMDHAFCSDGIFAFLMFLQTIAQNPTLSSNKYEKYFQKHATIPLANLNENVTQRKQIVSEFEKKYQSICIVRPSNTEPVLRLMVEDVHEKKAEKILEELKTRLLKN